MFWIAFFPLVQSYCSDPSSVLVAFQPDSSNVHAPVAQRMWSFGGFNGAHLSFQSVSDCEQHFKSQRLMKRQETFIIEKNHLVSINALVQTNPPWVMKI
jgi:hypothetical protein